VTRVTGPLRATILTGVDREAIERRDFPVGRRGYDQAAVDEHLRRVADEIEALRANPGVRPPVTPISAGTSDQVRAILEAAETGAAELRADAGRQAGEHVARVEEAADGMLAKIDELENQLTALVDALHRSSEQLTEGLSGLHEQVSQFGADGEPEPAATAPAPAPEAATAVPEPETPAPSLNGDEAGARLIALNMALSGTPREETARYLAEHYALADPEALLDDVYAQVGQ
jgi:DivIVA domain-containing protein